MSDRFEPGMRVRPRGWSEFGVVEDVIETPTGWRLYVNDSAGHPVKIEVEADGAADIEVLHSDGGAEPKLLLAGLWAEWMRSARRNGEGDRPRVDDSSAVPPPGRSGVRGDAAAAAAANCGSPDPHVVGSNSTWLAAAG